MGYFLFSSSGLSYHKRHKERKRTAKRNMKSSPILPLLLSSPVNLMLSSWFR